MLPEESAKPQLLDYAPPQSVAWRFVRKAFRYILLGGLLIAAYIWGPPVWHQAQMLYWQQQCMNFSAPAGTIVFDESLGATPAPPPRWGHFVDSAAAVGPALSEMPQYGSLVFLGKLTSPSEKPYLVAVAFTNQLNWWAHGQLGQAISYQIWVVQPGSLFNPPRSIDQLTAPGNKAMSVASPPLPRFYFGQHDPADPSHFMIQYSAWGQQDTVDGRIDDQGQVTITARNAPTAP